MGIINVVTDDNILYVTSIIITIMSLNSIEKVALKHSHTDSRRVTAG